MEELSLGDVATCVAAVRATCIIILSVFFVLVNVFLLSSQRILWSLILVTHAFSWIVLNTCF